MGIENPGSANIDNANNQATSNADVPAVGATSDIDVSNPFVVADMLGQTGVLGEIDDAKTEKKVDDASKTDSESENDDEESKITPEEAERFLQQDPSLLKIKEYEELGYSKEDATKMALGVEGSSDPAKTAIPEENYKIVDLGDNPYLKLSDQDKITVERMATSPTTQDLINYLQRAENKMAAAEGRQPESISELPEYEDAATNIALKNQLINAVTAEYQQHHRNLVEAQNTLINNQNVQNDFNQRQTDKLLKAFPALAAEDDNAKIIAQYFQDQMFSKRANMLDPQKRSNLKELEKVFDKSLKDFKPLFGLLCKQLNITFSEGSNTQSNAADLAKMKMQQMTSVNNSQAGTGGAMTINPHSVDASNPIAVGKLLTDIGAIES